MTTHFFLKEIPFFKRNISIATLVWFTLALVGVIIQLLKNSINNFTIFRNVFWHTVQQQNLYLIYENLYNDVNMYGPFFSVLIAPFAILPPIIGCFFWCMVNVTVLFFAIQKLPIANNNKSIILLITAVELMTAVQNVQYNPLVAAFIVLSYVLVKENNNFWAAFFIIVGASTKIYGIVGLTFFLFSNNKKTFILSLLFWAGIIFVLPMLIGSPSFILQSYKDWYNALVFKNNKNTNAIMQGMSVMRILKNIFQLKNIKDSAILGVAALLSILPALRFSLFKNTQFQLYYLAYLLIAVVIFSSSAESATYIIAMVGVGVWFVASNKKNALPIILLVFALLFTSLSTTDFFPKSFKADYVRPLALKALPCFLIWLLLSYKLIVSTFNK